MAEQRFGYARGVAPGLWMLVALGGAELLITHLILLRWSHAAAFALSTLTLAVIGWLAIAVASFRHRPVLLTDDALVWRLGRLKSVSVPRDAVGELREGWDAAAVKARGTLNFAAATYPNVLVDLSRPVRGRRRTITALAHRLDDPAKFATALICWRDCPTAPARGSGAA